MAGRKRKFSGMDIVTALALVAVVLAAVILLFDPGEQPQPRQRISVRALEQLAVPEDVDVRLITVDGHSRRGTDLTELRSIVIHYVGNPGTTAEENWRWYEDPNSNVSSHFLVGLEGEVIQCLPLHEMSSATSQRNVDTISIEVCHPDDTGDFNRKTYKSLVKLTAWLVRECGLEVSDVIRHHDATGKECPRYYVRNEDAWLAFLEDVEAGIR